MQCLKLCAKTAAILLTTASVDVLTVAKQPSANAVLEVAQRQADRKNSLLLDLASNKLGVDMSC
jgi:hypothetical protein